MNNKQVIAIFILGIALLLAAFWAGLNVIKNNTSASVNQSNQKQAVEQAGALEVAGETRYIVRIVASFGTAEEANKRTAELRRKYPSAHTQNPSGDDTLYRVNIGPYHRREDAQQVANELTADGVKGVMILQLKQN